jgi:hypothetical protein
MKRVIVWRRVDTFGAEYAEIELYPLRIEGEVILVEGSSPLAVSYRVDCDDAGVTARAIVRLKRDGSQSERVLVRGSTGAWTVDGTPVPQLDGLADVDLSVTPSTNTAPIRRLRLPVGHSAEVTAAWLKFPSLDVVPLRQTYRRLSATRYEYEAPDLSFRTELECDTDGIVRDYGGLWTRS